MNFDRRTSSEKSELVFFCSFIKKRRETAAGLYGVSEHAGVRVRDSLPEQAWA